MNLLLVEDEAPVSAFIKNGFETEGYLLDVAYDGAVGKRLFRERSYDAIILDMGVPEMDCFKLCSDFKKEKKYVPVLFLIGMDSLSSKVNNWDDGADDFLVKPFEFQELLLRVRALSRKSNAHALTDRKISAADLVMDIDSKVVERGGKRIDLTPREFQLLEYLIIHKNRIVSRADIAEKVWELDFETSTNVIDVYLCYLRQKIDKNYDHKLLHTVAGMGYSLREAE